MEPELLIVVFFLCVCSKGNVGRAGPPGPNGPPGEGIQGPKVNITISSHPIYLEDLDFLTIAERLSTNLISGGPRIPRYDWAKRAERRWFSWS